MWDDITDTTLLKRHKQESLWQCKKYAHSGQRIYNNCYISYILYILTFFLKLFLHIVDTGNKDNLWI